MGRFGRAALGALLACSLVPVPAGMAAADEVGGDAGAALVPGMYVEHEAIAYVVDDGVRAFSLDGGLLASAESLMDIDAGTAVEALEDDAGATGAVAAARSRSSNGGGKAEGGRLVLVRDEDKTAEQLIADLEADARVVFAEPNAIVETGDADGATPEPDETRGPDVLASPGAEVADGGDEGLQDGETEAEIRQDGENGDDEPGEPDAPLSETTFGQDKDEPATDLDGFLWGLDNDGRMAGTTPDKAVDMGYASWNDTAAAAKLQEVVVAVVDSGVDATNPDLAPVMWDEGLTSGIAETGKEDEHGFAAAADAGAGVSSTTGLADYHGTHVAGTIGAAWDGTGVSGLAGNARIMAVRHGDTLSSMLECFDYISRACDAGVKVRASNNSWGLGQGQWRSVDLAVTEVGRQGVVSMFASGNSTFDNDAAGDTAETLADNPYAIVVNAVDPSGAPSVFTQYGETTTDVMAPGSTILSTYATGLANGEGVAEGPQYLGEEDNEAALYESFDSESHAADGVDRLAFSSFAVEPGTSGACEIVEGGRRFDGKAALELPFGADAAEEERAGEVVSGVVDLSGLAEKPTYLSMRYTGTAESASGASIVPLLSAYVRATDGGWKMLDADKGSFGYGGDSWAGFSEQLPENTDWEHFQIKLRYAIGGFSAVGGAGGIEAYLAGTVVVDSIGLGSDLVPYVYMQGTSMACPAVVGAAAVIAGQGLDSIASGDAAKSAEKLAALVKGAAAPDARYEGLCSTGGHATVDGAADPGPAITEVLDDGDAVWVRGYFMSEGTAVLIDGAAAVVAECADLGDGKAELTVLKPAGFAGGQVVVQAEANGKRASHRVDLGKRVGATYYDQTDLPVPDELDEWGAWQLVGFDGYVYCLPRSSGFDMEMRYDHLLRYDPGSGSWERVPLPTGNEDVAGFNDGFVDASGATLDGALVLQLFEEDEVSLVRYTVDGAWEELPCAFPDSGGVPVFSTLGSDGEHLYLFGGLTSEGDSKAVYRADAESLAFEEAGRLSAGRFRPQVAYGGGSFAVSGGVSVALQMGGIGGAELLGPNEGGLDNATGANLPAGWLAATPVDFSALVDETGQLAYAAGAVEGGFALVGPVSDDGAADTYLLSGDGQVAVAAYGKRASQQALFAPAATAYRGKLYVLAGLQNEPYRVFSATAMETVPQPGDAEPAPKPDLEPDPDPKPLPVPTPDQPASTPTSDASAAAPKALARTGDRLAVTPLLVALAAGCLTAAASGRALSRTRPTSTREGRRRDRN